MKRLGFDSAGFDSGRNKLDPQKLRGDAFAALTGWKLDGKSPPRDNAAVALGQPCGSRPLAARASFC